MTYDFSTQRLFVDTPLLAGAVVDLERTQVNYLLNVLRMSEGNPVLAFNGRDGEWLARIRQAGKRTAALEIENLERAQALGPDLDYLFAPLKHARLDYVVQKAVEMGVRRLRPVLTRRTQAARVNLERMRANAIEAAEQCGVLWIPEVIEPARLDSVLTQWDHTRPLIVCDEDAAVNNPMSALNTIPRGALAVLIGPEGGFAPEERQALAAKPYVTAISLGPRILRADTAAVAALTLVQACLGDWR